MKYELIIVDEAHREINEAYFYYESKSKGLGDRFLEQLQIYIERIQHYPEHYQLKKQFYREAFIAKFPYVIIYEINGYDIIVYSVFNTWQSPKRKP